MTLPALLLFPTELLSESEEDQMSSNANSYDYGEGGSWTHGQKGTGVSLPWAELGPGSKTLCRAGRAREAM